MKDGSPLAQVVFMWHMHQPDYRDRESRRIELPWVRLHALKDYYDMPARLEKFPGLRQTFNLVPSLVEQIESTLSPEWTEVELDLFARPAAQLSDAEKRTILSMFFVCPEEHLIQPYPRYAALLRETRLRSEDELLRQWRAEDWRDLQVWRQLAWIDPFIRERDPLFEDFIRKGRGFSEEEKGPLLDRMRHWLGETLSVYRRLQDEGAIEVSVTPFYHPILPLLIDPDSVHEAMPDCPLPDPIAPHPEDARDQMERAIRFYEDRFGRELRGVWPSEGSVSQEVARLLADLGVKWFATDEEILERSIGKGLRTKGGPRHAGSALYRPYKTLSGEGPNVIFRDHRLSDLIGFDYQKWDPEDAAADFCDRLLEIREHAGKDRKRPLIPIILDGENCWEYYEQDGGPFLDALYGKLLETPGLECVTVSEALEGAEAAPLDRLSAGSWIDGNFFIWMGEEADRKAWALVEEARRALVEAEANGEKSEEAIAEAWEEIRIAQGSDWYWWFGDTHSTVQIELFDRMFRGHLMRVYRLLDLAEPAILRSPIEAPSTHHLTYPDATFVAAPILDGRETHFYEWRAAATFDPSRAGAAMRSAEGSRIVQLYYGGDRDWFYLRADWSEENDGKDWVWEIRTTSPSATRIRFTREGDSFAIEKANAQAENGAENGNGWLEVPEDRARAASENVFEAAVRWEILETEGADTLSFAVGVTADGVAETVPPLSSLGISIPTAREAAKPWFL